MLVCDDVVFLQLCRQKMGPPIYLYHVSINHNCKSHKNMRSSVKVLFIHGLESGVNGDKARYLRKHFNLIAPAMLTGAYNFNSNSFLVHCISNIWWVLSANYYEYVTKSVLDSGGNG